MIRVSCQQLAPRVGDFAANAAMSVAAIRESVAAGADVVVLPELATSGYVFTSPAEAQTVAITRAHSMFTDWADAAGPAVVVGGFAEQGDDGRLYNSAALVDSTGVLAVYRKTHLWDRERSVRRLRPGSASVVPLVQRRPVLREPGHRPGPHLVGFLGEQHPQRPAPR